MSTRKKSSVIILQKILDEKGKEYVENQYDNAWTNGTYLSDKILNQEFEEDYPALKERRKYTPGNTRTSDETFDKYVKPKIKAQWLNMRGTLCRYHVGMLQNGYPAVSVRLSDQSSAKLQLHQVPIWRKTGTVLVKGMTASHLCHKKKCLTCCVPEKTGVNTSRNYCPAYIIVNDILVVTCVHTPRCLRAGAHSK